MIWAELQSVIQLTVALDAIYLALREIRNPYVRTEERALANIYSTITERIGKETNEAEKDSLGSISLSLANVYTTFTGELQAFDRKDSVVGTFCVFSIVIYIILLIVSSFFYSAEVNFIFAFIVSVFGFLPIAIGFGFNLLLVRTINWRVRDLRLEIESRLVPREGSQEKPPHQQKPGV